MRFQELQINSNEDLVNVASSIDYTSACNSLDLHDSEPFLEYTISTPIKEVGNTLIISSPYIVDTTLSACIEPESILEFVDVNCPNCGAPITDKLLDSCPYCCTVYRKRRI